MNLPYLEFYSDGSFFYSELIAGVSLENDKFIDTDLKDLKAKKREPFGISIGAGIPFNRSKLHLNIDYVSGLSNFDRLDIPDIDIGNGELSPVEFDEERHTVFNFGFGVELFLVKNLMGYGGFSTDFSALNDSANIFDLSANENKDINIGEDFYHYSLGVDWKLKWGNIITGVTYTNSSKDFLSPYQLNSNGIEIENDLNSELKYTRWQFVIGLDITLFGKKLSNL